MPRLSPQERERMILSCRPAALHLARRYRGRISPPWEVEDLEGEALLALCRAVDQYDPKRDVPFRAFAWHKMHFAVIDFVRTHCRVSRDGYRYQREADAVRAQLTADLGRLPTETEMVQALGLSREQYESRLRLATPLSVDSLDSAPPTMHSEDPLIDFVRDPDAPTGEDVVARLAWQERVAAAREAMKAVRPREREVIAWWVEGKTFREIGSLLRLSESRGRQLFREGQHVARAALEVAP